MFFKTRKSDPVVTADEEDHIIKTYLERIALAYKDQNITAERMIEMELELIARRHS